MTEARAPWLEHYGDVPATLEYPEGSLWDAVEAAAERYPDLIAYSFMGRQTTYRRFARQVHLCARALRSVGVRENDRVTVCMPNCPQAVVTFYAVNLVGAIANMVHPLSGENEIGSFLKESKSVAAVTLDQFYHKFEAVRQDAGLSNVILARIRDELSGPIRLGYMLTEGRKIRRIPKDAPVVFWNEFMRRGRGYRQEYRARRKAEDPAVILYSGGTTGTTKGVLLSNLNFNALGRQIIAANPMFRPGDRMLAVMPMFHGFGLGISVHSMLQHAGQCVLVPRFTAESYAGLIKKTRCSYIAGVPTLFEALLRGKTLDGADLSCLKGVFSGGDSLSADLKSRIDRFLLRHNAGVTVREGYGTTECVTASCLTPAHRYREGSVGLPLPDTYYKIVRPGTQEEQPFGTDGEICISGPTVMMGYLDRPEETARTLRVHADGRTWVHTGDLGMMDEEGFVYFRQRIGRVIVTSGYNVYPSRLENILDANDMVQTSCVIGVPDEIRIQKVKAFVMLAPGYAAGDENREALFAWCRKNIARYAMPCEIEFREQLPRTPVGKVAYRVLEEEEREKRSAEGNRGGQ